MATKWKSSRLVTGSHQELERRTLGLRFKVKAAGSIWGPMLEGVPFILPDLFEDTPESRAYRDLVGGEPATEFPQTRSWLLPYP